LTQEAQPRPMEPKDVFKFVLDTRNFEITNFWQRSNYFLVLNTGLAIAFFNLKEGGLAYAPFVAAVGVLVSLLWNRVALGSKFWQVHWEKKLSELEKLYVSQKVLDDRLALFCQPMEAVKEEVWAALQTETHHNWVERFIDREVLKKPSVTLSMISLSMIFVFAWASVFIVALMVKP
jgi:hypothetical protein